MNIRIKTSVLIAEDDPIARQQLIQLLQLYSQFSLIGIAETGEQVLELCLALRPNLVILDLNMPGRFSGLTLIRHLKSEASLNLKVLVLTADSHRERLAYALGADKFLIKGVSDTFIIDTLISLI